MKTQNDFQNFGDEFLRSIREKEVWKKISANKDIPWNMNLLEKFADKLDWKALCENDGIDWDEEMLERFKRRIDWDVLSEYIFYQRTYWSPLRDLSLLKKFENYWNWQNISRSIKFLSAEIIEQFAKRWDWKELIDNRNFNWTFEMFERFRNYIPLTDMDVLFKSELWDQLVEIDEKILTGKLLSKV
ncbi:hypothetical protein BMS3Abin15_00579 [bacterium BMS3Abin15]|nr:hypothetical protein BMS3Abin15_00579 [bacterium BMS3Abin15]